MFIPFGFFKKINTFFGGKPLLTNFRIEDTNTDRVLFDSTGDISGLTSTGFTISGKTISSITINGTGTTGHYFTVSVAFDFWDNNTIRLESGDGTVYDFTLEYIQNNIAEPDASTYRYASASGSGSQNGLDKSNEWTLQNGLNNISAGQTLFVKAENYSGNYNLGASGNSTNPIKIIGYKTTEFDIGYDYYTYTEGTDQPALSATEAPLITNPGTNSITFYLNGNDYVIIKNIQTSGGYWGGIRCSSTSTNIVIDNCVTSNASDTTGDGSGFEIGSENQTGYTPSYYRITNCVGIDNSMMNFGIRGSFNLIDNVKSINTNITSPNHWLPSDYYIAIAGSNNIIRNSRAYRRQGTHTAASGHGIGIKAGESSSFAPSNYNLIENNTTLGMWESLYVRNTGADYNVFKNNVAEGYNSGSTSYGVDANGITLQNDANYNIFENNYIKNLNAVFYIVTDVEVTDITKEITGNIIRNNIVKACSRFFNFTQNWNNSDNTDFGDNVFYNNTFYDVGPTWNYRDEGYVGKITHSGNLFKNNIFSGVTTGTITGFSFDYNNFSNEDLIRTTTSQGTNFITAEPTFTDLIDFVPTNTSLKAGIYIPSIHYDYNLDSRNESAPTIGAQEI